MRVYYCHEQDVSRMFLFLLQECHATIINVKLHGTNTEQFAVYFQIDTNAETEDVIYSYWYNKLIWEEKPIVDEIF